MEYKTSREDILKNDKIYFNNLILNSANLLEDFYLLDVKSIKQIEFQYVNLLMGFHFVRYEYDILNTFVQRFAANRGLRPLHLQMHIKNYLTHIDSFIDYLKEFVVMINKNSNYNLILDRKQIDEFEIINGFRNQTLHECLPTIDYNYINLAPAHADTSFRQAVQGIQISFPFSSNPNPIDLQSFLDCTYEPTVKKFEGIVEILLLKIN